MSNDDEALYRQIGRIIQTMPDLDRDPKSDDALLWLGRAYALVERGRNPLENVDFRNAVDHLGGNFAIDSIKKIRVILYRALASAEAKLPAGVGGAFIPAGGTFDAYAAIAKVLGSAKRDLLLVDAYMDATVLTDFCVAAPDRVMLRLLAAAGTVKDTFEPAARRWLKQHGAARPLEARLAPKFALHDRAIFVDGTVAWTLTQSFNAFANRSPGEIYRADDIAGQKIPAYENVWSTAQLLVP